MSSDRDDRAGEAVADLAHTRGAQMLRLAVQLTHHRGLAEELVQESLMACYETWSRHGPPADPSAHFAYLRVVLIRRAIKFRRPWPRLAPFGQDQMLDSFSNARGEDRLTTQLVLWQAVGRLKRRERAALVLHYYLDLPHSQVAVHLGCQEGSARSLCSRGLVNLRAAIKTLDPEGSLEIFQEEGSDK